MAEGAFSGLGLAGTAFSVIGTLKKAEANAKASEAEAKAEDAAARIADRNAALAIAAAGEEEDRSRWESKQVLGSIRAAYGASGVAMDGTPQDVLDKNAAIAESNALAIRHRGAIQAWQFKEEAKARRVQRNQLISEAEYYRDAGQMAAKGQGLMGVFGMGKDYYTGGIEKPSSGKSLKRT